VCVFDTVCTTWIIPVTLFSAIFLLTGVFSYSEEEETDDLDDTLQSWLDEGVCIYDDMRKIMNPEILPTDDYYYKEIKDHHLYFVYSVGFTYRLDRLKPRASKFRRLLAKVYNILTLLLDFHTYAVIAYCTF
jgi:hypothetical protein